MIKQTHNAYKILLCFESQNKYFLSLELGFESQCQNSEMKNKFCLTKTCLRKFQMWYRKIIRAPHLKYLLIRGNSISYSKYCVGFTKMINGNYDVTTGAPNMTAAWSLMMMKKHSYFVWNLFCRYVRISFWICNNSTSNISVQKIGATKK